MKELVKVFALCAIAAGAAWAQTTVQSNIVGYQAHNLKAGPNLMGVAWEACTATDGKIALIDLMDTTRLTSYNGTTFVPGDYVQTWDVASAGWGNVYYYMDTPSWGPTYVNTWMDGGLIPCNPELAAGEAFWLYLKQDASDFPFMGQVAENGAFITLAAGQNLIANPIPRTIDLTDASVVEISGQKTSYNGSTFVPGDYVQVWDIGSGWGSVYYYMDTPSWGPTYVDTWMDGGLIPVAATIPAGSAFWYFTKQADVEITFKAL